MVKEIKTEDKISDSRIIINENFKELEERVTKLEQSE